MCIQDSRSSFHRPVYESDITLATSEGRVPTILFFLNSYFLNFSHLTCSHLFSFGPYKKRERTAAAEGESQKTEREGAATETAEGKGVAGETAERKSKEEGGEGTETEGLEGERAAAANQRE